MDSLTFMCFLSIINYSNILRIKIKSVYVKDFLISTKVRLKRGEHLHGEEPISSEPTFSTVYLILLHTPLRPEGAENIPFGSQVPDLCF